MPSIDAGIGVNAIEPGDLLGRVAAEMLGGELTFPRETAVGGTAVPNPTIARLINGSFRGARRWGKRARAD